MVLQVLLEPQHLQAQQVQLVHQVYQVEVDQVLLHLHLVIQALMVYQV